MQLLTKLTLLSMLILGRPAYSTEIASGENTPLARGKESLFSNQCSAKEKKANLKILAECEANWNKWGVSPKPKANELRNPNNCSSLISSGTLEGCTDALIALPVFLGEMSIKFLISTTPENKNTFAYVSQHGSLKEIKSFLLNDFLKKECGIAQFELLTYIDKKCNMPNSRYFSHINPEGNKECIKQGMSEVKNARLCFRSKSARENYEKQAKEITQRAHDIKDKQNEIKKVEAKFQRDLANIKSSCNFHLNKLSGSMWAYFNPILYATKEVQNYLAPRKSEVISFNECIERKTKGKVELRKALLKSSTGYLEQISGSFKSLKCYKEKERKALQCEVAMGLLSGGAGLSAFAIRRLGKVGVEKYGKRVNSLKTLQEDNEIVGLTNSKKRYEPELSELSYKKTEILDGDLTSKEDWNKIKERFNERYDTVFNPNADLQYGQNGRVIPPKKPSDKAQLELSKSIANDVDKAMTLSHENHHIVNLSHRLKNGNDKWSKMIVGSKVHPLYSKGYYAEEATAHYAGGLKGESLASKYKKANKIELAKQANQYAYLSYTQGRSFIINSKPILEQAIERLNRRGPAAFNYNSNNGTVSIPVTNKKGISTNISITLPSNLKMMESTVETQTRLQYLLNRMNTLDTMYQRKLKKLESQVRR